MQFDKLSKIFKTDIRYLVKGGGAMAVGQVCVSFIALIASIAFANLLPKESYGLYQYILSTAEFLLTFSLIGLSAATVRSVSKGFDGTLNSAFKTSLKWGLPAVSLGLIVSLYYLYKGNFVIGYGIGASVLFMLVINASKHYLPFLTGKRLFLQSSISTVVGLLIPSASMIVALFFTDNVLFLVLVYLLSYSAVNLSLYIWSRKFVENKKLDPQTIRHAKHLSVQDIIARSAAYIDRILLFQFTGPVALAEFWFAQNAQRQFSHIYKSANAIVLPKVSVRSFDTLQSTLPKKILLLYLFIIPFSILYVLLIPYLYAFLFPAYASSAHYAQVFGILFLFLPFSLLRDAFIGHSRNKILYKLSIYTSAFKIGITVVLVPLFGIWGVVTSTILNQFIYSLCLVYYFFKEKSTSKR